MVFSYSPWQKILKFKLRYRYKLTIVAFNFIWSAYPQRPQGACQERFTNNFPHHKYNKGLIVEIIKEHWTPLVVVLTQHGTNGQDEEFQQRVLLFMRKPRKKRRQLESTLLQLHLIREVFSHRIRRKLQSGGLTICKKIQIGRGHVDQTFVQEIQYGGEKEPEVTWDFDSLDPVSLFSVTQHQSLPKAFYTFQSFLTFWGFHRVFRSSDALVSSKTHFHHGKHCLRYSSLSKKLLRLTLRDISQSYFSRQKKAYISEV